MMRLLVIDDHTLVRQGIVKLLIDDPDIEVVGECGDGLQALEMARQVRPDAILMDLYMPGLDGISATRVIRRELPEIHVILISASVDEDDVMASIQAGAKGYILKTTDAQSFVLQVKQAVTGGIALSEDVTRKLVAGLSRNNATVNRGESYAYDSITHREREVLSLIAQGKPNKEVADILSISENTVRAHVRSLMQKLALDNRTMLAVYGVREGMAVSNKAPSCRNGTHLVGVS